ncbi:hypothetical protein K438DRAFT_1140215 [Mycena galopus ATCC 62051]|nr:hypothetical protein K438DRAFT_1140215 [Mycena galopus ATCC 62051]
MSQKHLFPLIAYWILAGDSEYLENIQWPLPLYDFTTGVLAVLCQAFLVVRYCVFTCSLMTTLYPSFGDRSKFKIPAACVPCGNFTLLSFIHL